MADEWKTIEKEIENLSSQLRNWSFLLFAYAIDGSRKKQKSNKYFRSFNSIFIH